MAEYEKDADRIRKICNDLHLSMRQLAITVGLASHNFYAIVQGRCGISKHIAQKINAAFPNYSLNWLLYGEEDTAPAPQTADAERIDKICFELRLSKRQLAAAADIQPQNLYDISSGKCKISRNVAMRINAAFPNYSVNWILCGANDIPASSSQSSVSSVNVVQSPKTKMRIAANTDTDDSKDRYIEWLQSQLEKAHEENKRLLDIILQMKK